MKHRELPRVTRRAVGLIRFARKLIGARDASIFLVDSDARTLRGVVSEWDWTRTSFASKLADWPTVARALADGNPHTISRREAVGAETVWFEPRGILSTVCVPLRAEIGPIGVLFFDFDAEIDVSAIDLPMLADVGKRCARALARRRSGVGAAQALH